MSYEMKSFRKEDLSLYYYIKELVLIDFVEKDELAALSYVPELSTHDNDTDPSTNSFVYETITDMLPNPTARGRGWRYFDISTELDGITNLCNPFVLVSGTNINGESIMGIPEQSNMVSVYDEYYNLIDQSQYIIDYIDGRIITSGTCNPRYVTYNWNYVSVVDEWSAIEAADPPVVVIDLQGLDKEGYQLGAGKKVIRKCEIHVFASNTAERNDLVETLYDGLYLRSCPMYDFPYGGVLDYDGTWLGRKENNNKLTSLFDRTTVSSVIGNLEFHKVSARHVNLPLLMTRNINEVMLSDLNAYRSKITFDLVSYTHI